MELSKQSQQSINEFADKIRKEVSLPFPTTLRNLKSLARDMGGNLSVLHHKSPDYKSIIKKVGDGFNIDVFEEKKDHYSYGCAHAIGHLILHIGYLSQTDYWKKFEIFEDNYNGTLDEAEADFFAECLLIPDNQYMNYCEKYDSFDRDNFRQMSCIFGVPVKDIIRKGLRLGIIDIKNM